MTRTILDKELEELDQQIQQLGCLVEGALSKALKALETDDLAVASMVIESDVTIDCLRTGIEEHAMCLLILQQPLGGRDLRYLTSVLSIASDLERIGDGVEGIARILLHMVPLGGRSATQMSVTIPLGSGEAEITEPSVRCSLIELGREALRVLEGTMKAFAERNVEAARSIWKEDDVVDMRYHLVRHNLMAMMAGARAIPALQHDSFVLQRATYLLWIAHKLERVGDHCGNICERLVFTVEGRPFCRSGMAEKSAVCME
ncbi:MAG TPA: phosphate signaling complex protein PhoU [Ktedonobacteraceae bacterium]|nr:phosphate signaling complex protein PhoU [Ktedonobacteraceae bacterium]